jgi:hypothetical protein
MVILVYEVSVCLTCSSYIGVLTVPRAGLTAPPRPPRPPPLPPLAGGIFVLSLLCDPCGLTVVSVWKC